MRAIKPKFSVQDDWMKARGKDFYLKGRRDLKDFVSLWSTNGFGKGCFSFPSSEWCFPINVCFRFASFVLLYL